MGMTQLPTSGGHPQSNRLVKRFIRTLKQILSKLVSKKGWDWDKVLGGVLFAYRRSYPISIYRDVTLLLAIWP